MRRPRAASRSARRSPISPPPTCVSSATSACRRTGWPLAGEPGEDADLHATVRAVGLELCAALGITIPVGKDSLSMRTAWTDAKGAHSVIAPVSLIISAFAPVADARRTLTAELDLSRPSRLLLIDLGRGQNRLGGSCWAQVFESAAASRPISTIRPWCAISLRRCAS